MLTWVIVHLIYKKYGGGMRNNNSEREHGHRKNDLLLRIAIILLFSSSAGIYGFLFWQNGGFKIYDAYQEVMKTQAELNKMAEIYYAYSDVLPLENFNSYSVKEQEEISFIITELVFVFTKQVLNIAHYNLTACQTQEYIFGVYMIIGISLPREMVIHFYLFEKEKEFKEDEPKKIDISKRT